MKLNSLIMITVAVSLLAFPSGCKRSPDIQQTQQELQEAQKALAEMQALLEKMKADINDIQSDRKLLKTQLEKAKTELAPTLKTFGQFKLQTDLLAAELEKTKANMTSVTKSLDELQQQISTLKTQKSDVLPKVNPQTPSSEGTFESQEQAAAGQPQAAKPQHDPALAEKLQEAESYVQAGNWQAAERLALEIQAADPTYPGLDALNSRVQNMKARINK